MVCTFGDQMDVEFWRRARLPTKQLIDKDGRIVAVADFASGTFHSSAPERAAAAHGELAGLPVARARKRIAELLAEPGSGPGGNGAALVGAPRPLEHAIKFYENGERPLEFVPTRQWFIRILAHKAELAEQGRRIEWQPPHMLTRYLNWVEGLNQDWCVSRQRYFGVPIPVWYPLDAKAEPVWERPIFADPARLPVDPLAEAPPGFREDQRGKPGGFAGDPDVFDTWATSSVSPQITSRWTLDPERHAKLFPADVRPQAHDIIRTWAFYTITKAWMHERSVPWHRVLISGWILDPDRKKMSKSKGNVVTPSALLDEWSVDAVRYWAARARLGVDTAFDAKVMQNGKRLVTKLWNASRFVFGQLDAVGAEAYALGLADVREPLDLGLCARLRGTVERATASFEAFDYAGALAATEESFWEFCDDYLELAKLRSYAESDSPGRRSALATLGLALRAFLRLFAPHLPYASEELWAARFASEGARGSVHVAPWPRAEEYGPERAGDAAAFAAGALVLRKIRAAKTQSKRSLRWPVDEIAVRGPQSELAALRAVLPDVLRAGAVRERGARLEPGAPPEGEALGVVVRLAETAE
jgi:valyl-tRNA synthetase